MPGAVARWRSRARVWRLLSTLWFGELSALLDFRRSTGELLGIGRRALISATFHFLNRDIPFLKGRSGVDVRSRSSGWGAFCRLEHFRQGRTPSPAFTVIGGAPMRMTRPQATDLQWHRRVRDLPWAVRALRISLSILLLALAAPAVLAQSTGTATLRGTVKDENGDVIPDAVVTLTS